MISPQFKIEDALAAILIPISGLNVFTSNRKGARLFPYVTIQASLGAQQIIPYSGVFEVGVDIAYSDSATLTSQASFDATYFDIFQKLYSDNNTLVNKVQDKLTDLKVFMGRITSQSPTIRADKRAWQRGLKMSLICTPSETDDGLRYLNFYQKENSMYVAVI